MSEPVYLDHAATTPVEPEVAAAMTVVLAESALLGNPASTHAPGRRAAARVDAARSRVAALLNAPTESIVFTSGATEADNLAVLGAARAQRALGRGDQVITLATEHKAVLAPCERLETEGFRVIRLLPEADGYLPPARLAAAVSEATALVSIMHVNNETGVVQDIDAIGGHAHRAGALMHVDAAQSAGRLTLDVNDLPVDLLSLSAHKLYGPPGIGALYVRRRPRARVEPLLLGGGQEAGLRSGTVPIHQVVGMGEAFRLARERRVTDAAAIAARRRELEKGLAEIGGMVRNGRLDGAAHILNVSVVGVHGEALQAALEGVAVSAGSACNAGQGAASHVLRAMGRPDALSGAALRLSLGRTTTERDVAGAVRILGDAVARLRAFSPLWRDLHEGIAAEEIYASGVPLDWVA